MRICYLAGANSIHSYRWIKFFADAGHEVAWISLSPSIFKPLKDVYYTEISWALNPFRMIRAAMRIRSVVTSFKPDIMHIHSVGSYGLMGLLSGFDPIIATPWGSDIILGKTSFLKRPFISRILSRATLITCDAIHMRKEIMQLGVPKERIHIINFGIDTIRFSPGPVDIAFRTKNELGDALVVISLRNFESIYDIPTLLKAIPKVLDSYPNTKFLLVGQGSQEKELKSMAKQLRLDNSIVFSGFLPNEKLVDILRSVDVYVSTSLSDAGISASTAEAMACGLPVIVTNSGENDRWISDGKMDILFLSANLRYWPIDLIWFSETPN